MKIAVMGAGAVGTYYGAMLARAGHEVVLIGRPALVQAVRARGLLLEAAHFTGHVALQADTRAAAIAQAELVLFCVKSGDTVTAAQQIAPHLASDVVVLSLQNGVDNADTLTAILGRSAIPAVVYVATDMGGPGHVRHHGRGELVIGPSARSAEIAALLSAAAIPATVSAQVRDALWAKLVINCVYNALSAISQLPYGELVRGEGVLAVMREVFDECLAVAQANAIQLPADLWAAVRAIADTMAAQRSSTAQDLMRGKPSEIDHLNGAIVRLGAQAGIATPVNRTLHSLVKLLEVPPH
ncbi:MAG: 2-dehydropantoate 2-reductase [Pseudoxanthomonas sp.]